jgi:hypothetical protein
MHLSHRRAAVALQLTINLIYEKHCSCVVDPTTNNVDKCLNVKKCHILSGIQPSETLPLYYVIYS